MEDGLSCQDWRGLTFTFSDRKHRYIYSTLVKNWFFKSKVMNIWTLHFWSWNLALLKLKIAFLKLQFHYKPVIFKMLEKHFSWINYFQRKKKRKIIYRVHHVYLLSYIINYIQPFQGYQLSWHINIAENPYKLLHMKGKIWHYSYPNIFQYKYSISLPVCHLEHEPLCTWSGLFCKISIN